MTPRQTKGVAPEEWARRLAAANLDGEAARVARIFSVSVDTLGGPLKTMRACRARSYFWARLRLVYGMSTPEIGALFARDHSTVCCGIARMHRKVRAPLLAA